MLGRSVAFMDGAKCSAFYILYCAVSAALFVREKTMPLRLSSSTGLATMFVQGSNAQGLAKMNDLQVCGLTFCAFNNELARQIPPWDTSARLDKRHCRVQRFKCKPWQFMSFLRHWPGWAGLLEIQCWG